VSCRRAFRLSDGNRIFEPGGLERLRRRYGRGLKRVQLETGEFVYRITGRYRERRVMTDFGPIGPRGQAEDVFILTG
jgi:hypothetical protein